MPELQIERKTIKVFLPSFKHLPEEDWAWVEVYSDLRAPDIMGVSKYRNDEEKAGVAVVMREIKDWNITINGEKAAISVENVSYLQASDTTEILMAASASTEVPKLDDGKKNTFPTITQTT